MDYIGKKCLVAYFSRRGKNYVSGSIVNLAMGNTQVVAERLQELTDGDLFEIDTIKKYPLEYQAATQVAQDELYTGARPELTEKLANIGQYEVVFLGYPNWWGTMPMAVWTFLESYDFSGKTILPFCTHEGSGLGRSESDVKKLCPAAIVKRGLAIRGSQVRSAEKSVVDWLDK